MKKQWISLRFFALALVVALGATFATKAQVSFGGKPASFDAQESGSLRASSIEQIPSTYAKRTFNIEDLMAQNAWSEGEITTRPLLVGKVIPTQIDFIKEAQRETLPSGHEIYRLRVFTDNGAKAVLLYYADFYIPENGGELFIYTPDKQNVLGAYTHATHPQHGAFATEPLPGSELILEYVVPAIEVAGESRELPTILIDGVSYIFNSAVAQAYQAAPSSEDNQLRMDEDGANKHECVINANCPEGDEWHAEKASVAQMLMVGKKGEVGMCTGTLINNTAKDFKPLILSAGHCIGNAPKLPTDQAFDRFIFTFHYLKPGCSSGSFAGKTTKTMVGCKPRAYSSIQQRTDGLLLEISQPIPASYRVYYAGWDSNDVTPKSIVGLHHPAGDALKLSYLKENVTSSGITLGTWRSKDATGCDNCHFRFTFTKGDTYGGSSGSPIWNKDHRIVGTLSGGNDLPYCGQSNLYGRLAVHWDKFASETNPGDDVLAYMKTILDPTGNGSTKQLDGAWHSETARTIEPIESVSITPNFKEKTVTVTWKDIDRSKYPSHWKLSYIVYRNGEPIGDPIDGSKQSFTESYENAFSAKDIEGAVRYGVAARYSFDKSDMPGETHTDSEVTTNGLVMSPLAKTVKAQIKEIKPGEQIQVTWAPAANMQELSCFGYPEKETNKPLEVVGSRIKGITVSTGLGNRYTPPRLAVGSFFYVEGLIDPVIDVQGVNYKPVQYYVNSVKVIPSEQPVSGSKYQITIISKNNDRYTEPFDLPEDWQPGQWVEVYLKRPKLFDAKYPLFVGLSSVNKGTAISAPSVALVKNTTDDALAKRGWFCFFDDQYMHRFRSSELGEQTPAGYPAIRPMITTASKTANVTESRGEITGRVVAKAKHAIPLPKILGYRVYCKGQRINPITGGRDYVTSPYFLHKGTGLSMNDEYKIEVVYEEGNLYQTGIEAITPDKAVVVYPTRLAEDGILNIVNAEKVSAVRVLTLDGQLITSVERPAERLDLGSLADGMYMVVLDTAEGTVVARIVR